MSGIGLSSFGLSPYGTGTPVTGAAPPTGTAGSRYINPATRDYEQDSTTKQLAQMPAIRQRVLLAVIPAFHSSTVYEGGIKTPRKMGTLFKTEMHNAVRATLKQLTDVEKVIRIDSITVERGGNSGRSRTTIEYTDLTTNLSDTVTA